MLVIDAVGEMWHCGFTQGIESATSSSVKSLSGKGVVGYFFFFWAQLVTRGVANSSVLFDLLLQSKVVGDATSLRSLGPSDENLLIVVLKLNWRSSVTEDITTFFWISTLTESSNDFLSSTVGSIAINGAGLDDSCS